MWTDETTCQFFLGHNRPELLDTPAPPPAWAFEKEIAGKIRARVASGLMTECEGLATFADELFKGSGSPAITHPNAAMAVWFDAITPDNGQPGMGLLRSAGLVYSLPEKTEATYLGTWASTASANGFQAQFKDGATFQGDTLKGRWTGGSNIDQSHHFAFFLQLGFNTGGGVLPQIASFFLDPLNAGDRNLSGAAMDIGARFAAGFIAPKDLGNVIRKEICTP
jgi:hypothetical protein